MTSDLNDCIRALVSADEEVLKACDRLQRAIELHQKDLITVKTVGTTINVIGAVATVLGLALVPVSGGASLAFTALGITATVGGSSANLVADVVDYFKRKQFIKHLKSAAERRDNYAVELTSQLLLVQEVYQCLLENGVDEEQAIAASILFVLLGQAEQFLEENSEVFMASDDDQAIIDSRTRVQSILSSDQGQLFFKLIGAIGKTAGSMPKATELVKFHGLLATVAKNTTRGVFAGLGIIMSIVEVRLLLRQRKAGHPCSYVVNDFVGQLSSQNADLKVIEKLCSSIEDLYIDSLCCETDTEPSTSGCDVIIDDQRLLLDISMENANSIVAETYEIVESDRQTCDEEEDDFIYHERKWKLSILKGGVGFVLKGFGVVLRVWPKLCSFDSNGVVYSMKFQRKI